LEQLKNLSEKIIIKLKNKGKSLSVAESLTGGLICSSIVDIPGCSAVFLEGVISYSNNSKIKKIGVNPHTIEKYGAVSILTASEMAEGILKSSCSDYAISTTGIAGPDGGSSLKPVGLVYIGIASKFKTEVFKYVFDGDRQSVRIMTAKKSFELFEEFIKKERNTA
jgi:nicotinamide-nucleotide amidase